jgi:hypothetical protein
MQTGVLHHLLKLLGDPCGTLRGLARRGLGAIRSLFGSARGLVRALIQRAVSFFSSKVAPAAASARETLQGSLEALKRRVEAVMRGARAAPGIVDDEPEIAADVPMDEVVVVQQVNAIVEEAPRSVDDVAPASCAGEAEEQPMPVPFPSAGNYGDPSSQGLVLLAPVIGRALVRALSRPRPLRPEMATYAGASP